MPTATPAVTDIACARCGRAFHCGMQDAAPCWCTTLPALPATRLDATAGCLCRDCLQAEVDAANVRPSA